MFSKIKIQFSIFLAAFYACTAGAAGEVVPVTELALGQSMAGGTLLNDSLYSNPASASLTQTYSVEGSYYGGGAFSVSILDTQTSSIGGGIGYYRFPLSGTDQFSQGMKLSMMGKFSQNFGWGASGKLLWGNEGGVKHNLKDMDAGLLARFSILQVGGFVRNLFGGDPNYRNQDSEFVLGARINYEETLFLSVAANTKFAGFNPYQIGVGFEYDSPYHFYLRAGFRALLDENRSFWTAGIGAASGRFGIHYGIEIPNQSGEEFSHMLSANFMI